MIEDRNILQDVLETKIKERMKDADSELCLSWWSNGSRLLPAERSNYLQSTATVHVPVTNFTPMPMGCPDQSQLETK